MRVGCPIRTSRDQSLLAAPPGFSQPNTSFIASMRQGIHQMPFSYFKTPAHSGKTRHMRKSTSKQPIRSRLNADQRQTKLSQRIFSKHPLIQTKNPVANHPTQSTDADSTKRPLPSMFKLTCFAKRLFTMSNNNQPKANPQSNPPKQELYLPL